MANFYIPVAPLETIGLFGFAWTSIGPPHVHWIAPLIFACLIAIANVCRPGSRSRSQLTGNELSTPFTWPQSIT